MLEMGRVLSSSLLGVSFISIYSHFSYWVYSDLKGSVKGSQSKNETPKLNKMNSLYFLKGVAVKNERNTHNAIGDDKGMPCAYA